ncbi:hypothetical protein F5Y08DRAFT_344333 [Xylaria arbuscula]|nr:hypothetical protein F5Y08DRAFT_344333 [Xylaria arbuscula]
MADNDYAYRQDCYEYEEVEGFPPRPQSPEPIKSSAFSYDRRNGFRVGNYSRAALEELTLLFRRNASRARLAIATKPWLIAQLRFYDIAFNKSAKVGELWEALEFACVDGGPPSIDVVQQQLVTQFAQKQQVYAQAVEKHKLDVEQWHRGNFTKLNDPSAEARYDLDWFFSKHFLNDDGSPAPNKTPEPVIIWDLNDVESLRQRIDNIPGLEGHVTPYLTVIAWEPSFRKGRDNAFAMIDRPDVKADHPTLEALFDPDRFLAKYFLDGLHGQPVYEKRKTPIILESWFASEHLKQAAKGIPKLLVEETSRPTDIAGNRRRACVIVGWAKRAVKQIQSWHSEIAQLQEQDIKREEREREEEKLAEIKPHTDYAREKRPAQSGPFTLNHLVGSYMVKCSKLEDEYRNCEVYRMTLDIHAPTSSLGAVAAFNFGILEGTMLLASSEDSLERFREEQAACSDYEDKEVSDLESHTTSGKRKHKGSQGTSIKPFKRRLGGGEESRNPNRFYLLWAGCETGTGELVLDGDDERTGHFDIDKSGITAQGQFFYRGLSGDEPFVFELLKVADEPNKSPDDWASYCESYRWHRW